MIYFPKGMELEEISVVFQGSVNDVIVCRDRRSAAGTLYTLLAVHDRDCARKMLQVMEEQRNEEQSPCLFQFAQNEMLLFAFPYREERKFSSFARGQLTSSLVSEAICVNLVMECLSSSLPWPLLYLVLEQDCVQITKDNTVYFGMTLDLAELKPELTEKQCVSSCARLLLELLSAPVVTRRSGQGRRKPLKSFELIRKKSGRGAYNSFPELYHDIKLTALPGRKPSLKKRATGVWNRNRDILFRLLLVVCILLLLCAAIMVVSQVIFGDIPLLRLFQNCFDVIGTENLHRRGG